MVACLAATGKCWEIKLVVGFCSMKQLIEIKFPVNHGVEAVNGRANRKKIIGLFISVND